MIVTTAGKNAEKIIKKAKETALLLKSSFLERGSHSISSFIEKYNDDVLMIGVEKISYHPKDGSSPFFFHPNSSMFRVKQLLRGDKDAFVEAAKLKPGMSLLDCTLGLGSDSIVGSLVAGEDGKVTGIESSKAIAFVVQSGLSVWDSSIKEMNDAMRRIEVVHGDHYEVLKKQSDHSFDVVYFDPMFESSIQSPGIQGLKGSADYRVLTPEVIKEAFRVASQRVVLKDSRNSSKFNELGFTVIQRNASFLYGVLEKNT
ncbi:class I SAM-dependent methyltransferase [Fictibacillus phosphorivorans]|uniref:class I SAM-dependent methyltransferase n=1 Tax=Fictibacillus phosphorivorans TaxID=1221500 RepID=UPI0020416467|nr:class I SAM-dependent methyltransferase [Fictibacillus phosphorivorans]MCM3719645.1 class I SAM-dependent methyltransferase [Fictibacillus phosphorivorans]MCM3777281.1 class I SAM-dependent methyltransferase [Fictibacillus phosphorivorans]